MRVTAGARELERGRIGQPAYQVLARCEVDELGHRGRPEQPDDLEGTSQALGSVDCRRVYSGSRTLGGAVAKVDAGRRAWAQVLFGDAARVTLS